MKKITDLREGDLLTLEMTSKLFGMSKKTLYNWRAKSESAPDKYPKSAKIGGTVFFLKSDIIAHINKEFSKAS